MASPQKFTSGIDLDGNQIINLTLHNVTVDPSSPIDGQLWYRTDEDVFKFRADGVTRTFASLDDLIGGAITGALWGAQSVVAATAAGVPLSVNIDEDELLGRITGGNVAALTAADVRTILGIEDGSTADQTDSEILTALTNNAETNVLTDAELTKLQGVETGATDDQSASEIKTAYESNGDTNAFTDADESKLDAIEAGATGDQTATEIMSAVQTVDGSGSGLDADTVDGLEASAFALTSALTGLATETYVGTQINAAIDGAPGALDTLNELAAALGDDANFSTTMTNSLATKTGKYAEDIGDGTTTDIAVTHSLGTEDVIVSVKEIATNAMVHADVTVTSSNVVTIGFTTAPATNTYRVVVVG